MTDSGADPSTIRLELTPSELQLTRAALRLLRNTLGKEEADELEEVQRLLARIDAAAAR
jgi:hypothetical protein